MTQEFARDSWPGVSTTWRNRNNISEDTPEILAIFKQIKNLRECDRSLRSLRRNLELDNIPLMEEEAELQVVEEPKPQDELDKLFEAFMELRTQKDDLTSRVAQMEEMVQALQTTVKRQAEEIESLQNQA